jgi:hypothetical protein
MTGNGLKLPAHTALAAGLALLLAALAACGTIDRVRGKEGAKTELEARNVAPEDPLARPIQVGWTSARASYCGFVFDPNQLRANFMAAELRAGNTPDQMQKIEHAYDYTHDSVAASIKSDVNYCSKDRVTAIRTDLNRYLGGDYTPSARMGR